MVGTRSGRCLSFVVIGATNQLRTCGSLGCFGDLPFVLSAARQPDYVHKLAMITLGWQYYYHVLTYFVYCNTSNFSKTCITSTL